MQFKYFLYWTAVGCAGCQMLLALYARFYGEIAEQIQGAPLAPAESELAVVQALNYAMPVGIGCLLFLCYTWKINKVGGFALVFALGLQAAAMDLSLRAARHVFGEKTTLASIAWWAPKEKNKG
jgi:hypothetical protein